MKGKTRKMTHDYVQAIQKMFKPHVNLENASHMSKYMRDQFAFLGIKTVQRREILQQFIKTKGKLPEEVLEQTIKKLWNLPEREYQYIALDLLDKRKTFEKEDIAWIEWLIIHKSWWDTVDWLSSKIAGRYFNQFPEQIPIITEEWIHSDNLWLKRSALLFQKSYKDQTDEDRLYRYIEQCLNSEEFFIDKAIGWALREYSKTKADSVVGFVENHDLSKLSETEALKWLKSKRMI